MRQTRIQKKLNKTLCSVKAYKEKMASLSDEELSGMTEVFRQRLSSGETLDDILPEAFAAICEVDYVIL